MSSHYSQEHESIGLGVSRWTQYKTKVVHWPVDQPYSLIAFTAVLGVLTLVVPRRLEVPRGNYRNRKKRR